MPIECIDTHNNKYIFINSAGMGIQKECVMDLVGAAGAV